MRRYPGLARLCAAIPALGLVLGLSAACASYPHRTASALRDFERGHFDAAQEAFGDPEQTGSAFLSGAEAGTAALVAGDWESALAYFDLAVEAAEEIEGRARIGPESLGEGLGSWVFNDTSKAYLGEGFERVYVHSGLALAYLAQGQMDSVYVEARRSNELLEVEEKLYEKSYHAGGLGHFLSAVAYELLGEPDQAYVDYLRMEEKGVGTELAGRELVRLATRMHRKDELARLVPLYGPDPERPADAASVVLIAGVGLGPYKVGGQLPIPTDDGVVPISAARFEARPQTISALRLRDMKDDLSVETVVLEDVARVAEENLADRIAWQVVKSTARGFLKRELTKSLEKEFGSGGRFAGDLFALFTERPDLRCWQTLPDTWQGARLFVVPGVHRFTLEAYGGESVDLGVYELEPGETLLVIARSIADRLYVHPIGGRPIREYPDASGVGTSSIDPH